ncbi:MAG: protein translocase subunit SecD [Chloroflexi bacterium]|nr:protein translocase subunit SecD [Chloroflexota bacterium]
MRRPRRGLVLLAILFVLSIVVLAVPTVKIDTPIWSLIRGDDENILGLSLGLDLKGGSHLVYRAVRDDGSPASSDDLEGVRKILEKRVSSFGLAEPTIQLLGNPADRILVQLPGLSGASIAVGFDGNTVAAEEFEAFLRSDEVGHPEATVNIDDNQLIAQMDELRPAVRDIGGLVITEAEGDTIRRLLEDTFPVTAVISFAALDPLTGEIPEPEQDSDQPAGEGDPAGGAAATPQPAPTPSADGGDPGDPTPTDTTGAPADENGETPVDIVNVPVVPDITIAQIQAVLVGVGVSDAVVEEIADNAWSIEILGVRAPELDEEANPLPTLADEVEEALEELSPLALFATVGTINQYVVGGGVQEAKHLIGQTARLDFRERVCGSLAPPTPDTAWPPDGLSPDEWLAVRCTDPTYWSPPYGGGEQDIDIQGSDLTDAFAGTQAGVVGPVVNLTFNDHGSEVFCDVTGRISRATSQDVLAIYLDGEELVAPSASTAICNGRAFIFGNFTAERARTVSIQLRSGSLPVELELIQERNVDATLGSDSLRKSMIAGAIGLALVLVFMVLYYKIPGVVAALALILYAVVLLALFKLIPVTLTLSGVAALILSIGLAVDANILIAERTKEELRMGRALLASITTGFDRAWPSIRDGNISTIITCVVLFWFGDRLGTSLIQGFALTLGIGVVVSMFTAFFASRVIMRSIAGTRLGNRLDSFVPVGTVGVDRAIGVGE